MGLPAFVLHCADMSQQSIEPNVIRATMDAGWHNSGLTLEKHPARSDTKLHIPLWPQAPFAAPNDTQVMVRRTIQGRAQASLFVPTRQSLACDRPEKIKLPGEAHAFFLRGAVDNGFLTTVCHSASLSRNHVLFSRHAPPLAQSLQIGGSKYIAKISLLWPFLPEGPALAA